MFRELSQKKNIITLVLIVCLLFEYFALPVSAFYLTEEVLVDEIVTQQIVEQEDDFEYTIQDEFEIETEETIEETIETNTVPMTGAPSEQITVESEVIDEYFDDAQVTGVYAVPSINTNFKSYTNYTLLNKRSIQWKLQEKAYTDENGLRKIDNYYLAAMGSYYSTTIGDTFRLTTDTGVVFDIILCDGKSDRHTDSRHMYTVSNNCMVEFYVDMSTLNPDVKRKGSVGILSQFSGSIDKVEALGHYEW